jgi:hypothetical protein
VQRGYSKVQCAKPNVQAQETMTSSERSSRAIERGTPVDQSAAFGFSGDLAAEERGRMPPVSERKER